MSAWQNHFSFDLFEQYDWLKQSSKMEENESVREADIECFIEAHVKYQKTFSEVEKSLTAKNFFDLEKSIDSDQKLESSTKENLLKSGKFVFVTDRQTDRHTDIQTYRHTDRQTDIN